MEEKKLEARLAQLSEKDVEGFKKAFSVKHINPRQEWRNMPYLKGDLCSAIVNKLSQMSGETSENFVNNLYTTINKEPLKRVYYGIRSIGNPPEEFLNSLTDWEKIYFFAGRWKIRNPNLENPIDLLTVDHMYRGLNLLYSQHYKRKASGKYERDIRLPEDKEIRETYKRIKEFYKDELNREIVKEKKEEKNKEIVQENLF